MSNDSRNKDKKKLITISREFGRDVYKRQVEGHTRRVYTENRRRQPHGTE